MTAGNDKKVRMEKTPPCEICGRADGTVPYGMSDPRRWIHVECWEAERDALRRGNANG